MQFQLRAEMLPSRRPASSALALEGNIPIRPHEEEPPVARPIPLRERCRPRQDLCLQHGAEAPLQRLDRGPSCRPSGITSSVK